MSDHRREERKREIPEYICAEPTCEFFGRPTQQGVCHTDEPDVASWERIAAASQHHADEIRLIRREHYPDDSEYIAWLESMYECSMLNWSFTLDDCIGLRREVARLREAKG